MSYLSSLLYYNLSDVKNGSIKKGVKEYNLLLSALIEAIEAFEACELEKFDSLVGENACQIRAVRTALIHANQSINLDLKKTAQEVRQKLLDLIDQKINSLMSQGTSLREVFDEYQLDIPLSDDELFLLKSFLLAEMKEVFCSDFVMTSLERKEKSSPTKIKRFDPEISYSFSSKLLSHIRKNLSKSSVQFVQKHASELNNPQLAHMVSDNFLHEHNALHCIPMYWSYKVLLSSAESKNLPIIAHIKFTTETETGFVVTGEKHLFFKPQQNAEGNLVYLETLPDEQDLKKAACVIQGVAVDSDQDSCLKTLSSSIVESVLAGAADHRQYPDSNIVIDVDDFEFKSCKESSVAKGFSRENPSTFFIQHVFASQVQSCLKQTA